MRLELFLGSALLVIVGAMQTVGGAVVGARGLAQLSPKPSVLAKRSGFGGTPAAEVTRARRPELTPAFVEREPLEIAAVTEDAPVRPRRVEPEAGSRGETEARRTVAEVQDAIRAAGEELGMCRVRGARGRGVLVVVARPDGAVTPVLPPAFAGTPAGACIQRRFARISMPFAGAPFGVEIPYDFDR